MADSSNSISRYLYATSNINLPKFFHRPTLSSVWSPHANWMGYVAITTHKERLGRRDIVIAWRGTVTYLEWIYDLKGILRPPFFSHDPTIKVESGFYDLYTKKEPSCTYYSFFAREQVLSEVKRLLHYYRHEEISNTKDAENGRYHDIINGSCEAIIGNGTAKANQLVEERRNRHEEIRD
ncbi:hypothetical protein Fmac_025310 [Flemingia macrophylla]|uniref:Fungal lipase-type domain-containing protein n=1 Tax=Flemingia macrophylla TaxID=520843 RepID=A0ABD1LRV6_9FABA